MFGEKLSVRWGLVAFQSLSTIKKGTSPLNFQSNAPFFKFLRQRFLYNLYMPPGHNLQPLPRELGGGEVAIFKDLISRTSNYVEENCYLKILIGCVWGNGGRERGVSCPPITSDY